MNDPSTLSSAHEQMKPAMELIATLRGGTAAMREAGTLYLPLHPNESGEAYEARRQTATLLNVLEDSIENCVDRVFTEQWRINETSPPEMLEWAEDIDLKGTNFHNFGKQVMDAALADGLAHILCDYPTFPRDEPVEEGELEEGEDGEPLAPRPAAISLAQERALGLRPYLTLVKNCDLIAAYTRRVAGETIVYHARVREVTVEVQGFEEVEVERIRVLEPGAWYLYEKRDDGAGTDTGGWELIDLGEMRKSAAELWDRVPLFTFYAGKKLRDYVVKPVFLDLAYLNVRHWQSTSSQQVILDQARFPMLAVSGFEGPMQTPNSEDSDFDGQADGNMPFTVGPRTVLTTGDPAGKWYYVEPTGNSIKLGAEDLKSLEEQMQVAGIEPLMMKPGRAQTATEDSLDEAKARAPLEVWARELSAVLEKACNAMIEWAGVSGFVEVSSNTEVGVSFNVASDVGMLVQMKSLGVISNWTFFQELMRRGFLGSNFDPKLEGQRLLLESPPAPEGEEEPAEEEEGAAPVEEQPTMQ